MPDLTFLALPPSLVDRAREAALEAGRAVVAEPDDSPFPVRCCLTDVSAEEGVLLLSIRPPGAESPYAAAGPVYVHRERCQGYRGGAGVPDVLRSRLLSLRGYDAGHMITATAVVAGHELEDACQRLFGDPDTAYLFAHFAGPGCYACRIERAA
jgi:hypothetical protein